MKQHSATTRFETMFGKGTRVLTLLDAALTKAQREHIVGRLSSLPWVGTGLRRLLLTGRWVKDGWGVSELDPNGRILVVLYKGVEVALYFKRRVTESFQSPMDPVPAGVIREPDEAWRMFPLISIENRMEKTTALKQENRRLCQELIQMRQRLIAAGVKNEED